jgi:molybdate transport system substrate-binding protein
MQNTLPSPRAATRGLILISTALWAAVIVAAVGCGDDARRADEIEILCGGSFRPPMEKLAKQFEQETGCRATLVFGQCEDHLPKVKMHTVGDAFVAHDPFVQYTEEAGAMLRYVVVGYVAPVLVVKKGNPEKIERIEDLARPGLRVVLSNPEFSTCGEMVFALLEKKQIKEAVLKNVGNALVRTHAQSAAQIKLGHRDAGVMWNGIAHNWLDALEIIPGPYEYDREVRVAVIGLSYSKKKDRVEQFLEFVETHGEKIFREFGYVK